MHFKYFPFPQTLFRSDVPSVPDQDVRDPLEAKETRGAQSGPSFGPSSGLLIFQMMAMTQYAEQSASCFVHSKFTPSLREGNEKRPIFLVFYHERGVGGQRKCK